MTMEAGGEPEESIESRINRAFGEAAGVDPDSLNEETVLRDYDSLALIELAESLNEYGIELSDEELFSLETLGDVYKLFDSPPEQ